MITMTDTPNEDLQDTEIENKPGEEAEPENHKPGPEEESQTTPGNFREASYVVLFIAAVFVINAMETGSYRTPWPVAIVTLLAGLGLFGYSWYLQSSSKI
jgi:hypothetical protein